MPDYAGRDRSVYRARKKTGEDERFDAITAALTAQVIICVLLLGLLAIIKKADETGYLKLKEQYTLMLEDSSQTEKAIKQFSEFSGMAGSIIEEIQKFADELLNAIPLPSEPEKSTDGASGKSEAATVPQYDYLDKTGISYISAGGAPFPGSVAGNSGMLFAPEGATLSPVYLGAKIKPPITGLITSDFSYRYHPVTGKNDFHTGIDIAAEEGRPILAALPGEVKEVSWSENYGNYIILQHATNLMTSYSHCSKIIAKEGTSVRQGERIALVGQTGLVTGPHLHFSVIVEGEFTDPEWILGSHIKLVE